MENSYKIKEIDKALNNFTFHLPSMGNPKYGFKEGFYRRNAKDIKYSEKYSGTELDWRKGISEKLLSQRPKERYEILNKTIEEEAGMSFEEFILLQAIIDGEDQSHARLIVLPIFMALIKKGYNYKDWCR
jgi:hypothetical protein